MSELDVPENCSRDIRPDLGGLKLGSQLSDTNCGDLRLTSGSTVMVWMSPSAGATTLKFGRVVFPRKMLSIREMPSWQSMSYLRPSDVV